MENTQVDVRVWHRDAENTTEPLSAYTTDVPGLVVHKGLGWNGKPIAGAWDITHIASGFKLNKRAFSTRRQALDACALVAERFGEIDWTQPGDKVLNGMSRETQQEILRTLEEV